jgi:methylmalonyl-CoA/ethylmalonyl-CoA epimerase
MNGLQVHHYGLATGDLEASARTLEALGYHVGDRIVDPIQCVRLAFARRGAEAPIELVTDVDEGGPTGRIVAKGGNGFYHVCYEVADLEQTVAALRPNGFLLLRAPVPAVAFDGRRIVWMYSRSIGLVELLEGGAAARTVDGAGR